MTSGVTITLPELIALRFHAKAIALSKQYHRTKNKIGRNGENAALGLGRGLEFAEVRAYQAGDDIRSIDWRVTARTGKPHTKLYQEEREQPLWLAVDYGQSMFFGTRVAFKSVIAAQAASLIAWLASEEKYRIGGLIFSEEERKETRPSSGQQGVLPVLKLLSTLSEKSEKSHHPQALMQALIRLQRMAHPGSTVVLITDFSGFDRATENHLCQLASHCHVVVIFIYDPVEKQLPASQQYAFTNNGQFAVLDGLNANIQKKYAEHFLEKEAYLKKRCFQLRIPFIPLATNDDLVFTLSRGLSGVFL